MSNLPLQSAVMHNDDNDDQTNNKLSPINSRITSRLIMKRQQYIETKIANNQACDEIHDLQPKYSAIKKTNNDNSYTKTSKQNFPVKSTNSHELMQGNYYDRTRFDADYSSSSSSNHQSEPGQIAISVEDYKDCKKKCTPVSASEISGNKDRNNSPPFGDTSESIQQSIAQSAGRLLELNKNQHHHKNSMKNNTKSHERAAINYFPNDNDNKQRSLSSSSSTSSDCSTDDSSTSNKCQEDNEKTNIPYEKLLNDDEDDDDELIEQPKKQLVTESSTLLNKNLSQTYGTQSTTNERSKYLSTNGYNSHGSSITTKSSSDNSGSIRTNSGSDNDEESDEEPYNNSTLSNNMSIYSQINDSSTKSISNKKSNDLRYSYSNEQNSYQLRQSNTIRSEQIGNNDEHHLQVPRFKQLPIDDSNGNNNKINSGTDHNILPYTSKRSSQQSSINQTNTLSSSSQQNRNYLEQQQQQQQQQNSNLSRNNSRQQIRKTKKRKQSQQQDIIRTELIPGHRGDRDVDELVMFIDGNSSKQPQNSVPLHPTDTNKSRLSSKINSLNDSNSNKTSSRKKSRKLIKSTNNNENKTSINQDNQTTTTHSIIDITNQSLKDHENILTESHLNTINGESWFEQTVNTSSSPSINEIIAEPFVTVTHRRRLIKERRQDNNTTPRSSRFPLPIPSSSNTKDKRRISNGTTRPIISNKSNNSSITKEENHNNSISSESVPPPSTVNPMYDQSLEKQETSPRLSSHSSSSSLSSLLKKQSKIPPVVFLNKSIDIELNDVSFGFDLDSTTLDKISNDNNNNINQSSTIEQDIDDITNISTSPSIEPTQSNENLIQKTYRKFQQRNNRGPQFYSGSDIRPQNHRNYPSQTSYIDPLLILQYNQQRLANYSQQLAYMNYLRTQYISPQSQYIFFPTTYPTTTTTTTNETDLDDETNQTSNDQIQEPLLVYTTPTGQYYFQSSTTKKPYNDSEQSTASIPTVYTTTPPTIYPTNYYYPSQIQHLIPSQTAYFQPIASPSLLIETKSEQNDINNDDDGDYENSTKVYHQIGQQPSSDIMSNALQLVYSQQRKNAQTDRFNLDDLTAYLAMKWTDTVDHYVQGDSRILFVDEQ